jgi:hypothetical protein
MNIAELIAIDVHTHAEVSCHQPFDEYGKEFDDAKVKYFKSGKLPTKPESFDCGGHFLGVQREIGGCTMVAQIVPNRVVVHKHWASHPNTSY